MVKEADANLRTYLTLSVHGKLSFRPKAMFSSFFELLLPMSLRLRGAGRCLGAPGLPLSGRLKFGFEGVLIAVESWLEDPVVGVRLFEVFCRRRDSVGPMALARQLAPIEFVIEFRLSLLRISSIPSPRCWLSC